MTHTPASPVDALLADHLRLADTVRTTMGEAIARAADALADCVAGGGQVLWLGNGGSAADAQHLAAEMVGRYETDRRGLPAVALTTDSSILTAVSNDFGFERVFARQVEALCRPGDLVVGISTSGNSPNVVAALEAARGRGGRTLALTGEGGGRCAALADQCLAVPSRITARVQEMHILIGHILCAELDRRFGD